MILVIAGRSLMNHLSARWQSRHLLERKLCGRRALLPRTLSLCHPQTFTPTCRWHPLRKPLPPHPRIHFIHPPTPQNAPTRSSFLMSNGALSSRVSATGVERAAPFTLKCLLEHLMLNVTNETVWTRWAHTRRLQRWGSDHCGCGL